MIFKKNKNKIRNFFSFSYWTNRTKDQEKGAIVLGPLLYALIEPVIWGAIIWYVGGKAFSKDALNSLLASAANLLLIISRILFGWAQSIFETLTSSSLLQHSITKDPTVLMGWGIVRDFANMFIVLGFVVVGIATILRIREYEAQKLLLPLILVALLINFSPLICGIIIDATNIMMSYFLGGTNVGGVATSSAVITTPLANSVMNVRVDQDLKNAEAALDINKYMSVAIGTAIYTGVAAMVIFIFGILFLFRYVALMCLVILSPLAFVCYVFSATKSIFDKWWNQFVQWAIIGVPTAFFVYLAGHIMASFGTGTVAAETNMASFLIPVAFLLFGYTLIFQISAVGAGAAIGLATGAVGFVAGATGKTKAGQWVKDRAQGTKAWGAGVLEKIPLIGAPKGTAANIDARRKEAARKEVKNMSDDQVVQTANQKRFLGGARGAAAIEEAAERKILHKLGDEQHVANRLSYAEAYGGATTARKDAEKLNPLLAKYNTAKIAEYMKPVAKGGKGIATEAKAKQLLVNEAYQKLDVGGIRELSKDAIKDPSFVDNVALQNPRKLSKAVENMSQEKIEEIKKLKISSAPIKTQGPEAQALYKKMSSLPLGSPERNAMRKKIAKLQSELKNSSYLA